MNEMDNHEFYFLLGFGSAAALYAAYYAALYGVDKYREGKRIRREYEHEFGFKVPEFLSLKDIKNELARHRMRH